MRKLTYSRGYCWSYWEYYKNNESPNLIEKRLDIRFDGYTQKQLYVEKKYSNYKEELLHHVSYNKYKKFILNKAIKKMSTKVAKGMRVKDGVAAGTMDLWPTKAITTEHLMSVIAYCDMDQYSTNFSNTFRKLKPEETFQSVKARHREYWWQSKLLKELVVCYGSNGYIDGFELPWVNLKVSSQCRNLIQISNATAESGPFCMYFSLQFP